jgi:hypothetical protein
MMVAVRSFVNIGTWHATRRHKPGETSPSEPRISISLNETPIPTVQLMWFLILLSILRSVIKEALRAVPVETGDGRVWAGTGVR